MIGWHQDSSSRKCRRLIFHRFGSFCRSIVNVFKEVFSMENQEVHEGSTTQVEELEAGERHRLAKRLDAVGWGLFFVWVGIAFLADFDVGVGLLGVGIIILGEQAARKYCDLKLEGFWVVVGLLFVVGGLWELFEAEVGLVPILLIVVGLALLVSAAFGKRPTKK
jgi:hypothetical protein